MNEPTTCKKCTELMKIIEQKAINYRAAIRKVNELSDENSSLATQLNDARVIINNPPY